MFAGRVRPLDERDVHAERAHQLQDADQGRGHGHQSEIRRHQDAGQDHRADEAQRAVEELEQHHPCGAGSDTALQALHGRFCAGRDVISAPRSTRPSAGTADARRP